MGIVKNSEVKFQLIIFVVIIAIISIISKFTNINTVAALCLLGAIMILAWYLMSIKRYRNIQKMIDEIDMILHGKNDIKLSDYKEGDLSILRNEISKMTLMLYNQADMLKKDKVNLADALADISHQIRTPLTSLNILAATIAREDTSEEKKRESAYEISRLLSRIDWLVTTLLKLAKIDSGAITLNKNTESLEKLVNNSIEPLEIMFELKGIHISKDISGNFAGDLSWTCEAVSNILKNCAEHMQQEAHYADKNDDNLGNTDEESINAESSDGEINIKASENAIYSELIIKDNGKGIDKEDLPYVFERFYKGKNSGKQSYGIGLALARTIITNQNGTIKAENNPEGGACFTIRFYK